MTGTANGEKSKIKFKGVEIDGFYHKYSHGVFTDTKGNNYIRIQTSKFWGWVELKKLLKNKKWTRKI